MKARREWCTTRASKSRLSTVTTGRRSTRKKRGRHHMTDDQALLPFEEGNAQLVRRQWHEDRWFFSVVDVVGLLSEAASARTYWAQLKAKLGAEGAGETLQALKQLKMR